jgi:hypothetical protein
MSIAPKHLFAPYIALKRRAPRFTRLLVGELARFDHTFQNPALHMLNRPPGIRPRDLA